MATATNHHTEGTTAMYDSTFSANLLAHIEILESRMYDPFRRLSDAELVARVRRYAEGNNLSPKMTAALITELV